MQNRSLQINTKFFDEDNDNQQSLNLMKESAMIQLDNKIKTLLLKRLFFGWSCLKYLQSRSSYDNAREETRNVQQRLKSNVRSIREMNKGITSGMSSEKKYKSLSPTCSTMGQSRALILREIVQKLKHRQVDHEDTHLKKSLNRLQRMLGNIKMEHSKTEQGNHKITKLFTKEHLEHSSNINAQQCLQQIQTLKLELQSIKKAQQNLWKNRHQQSNQQEYRKKSIVQSFPTMINILNEPISQQSTYRYQVIQPKAHDYHTSRNRNQFQQSKITNSLSQRYNQPLYLSPYQHNTVICQNCSKSSEKSKRSFTAINTQLNSSNLFQQPVSRSINNSFHLVQQKPITFKFTNTLASSIYPVDDRICFHGKPHFKHFI